MGRPLLLAAVVVALVAGAWLLLRDGAPGPGAPAPGGDAGARVAPPAPSDVDGPRRPEGEAATLRGTVLDSRKRPAGGAEVLALVEGREAARGTAGEDGAFALAGLPPGEYVLVARLGEQVAEAVGPVPVAAGEELAGLVLVLGPGGSLAGTVIDGTTGEAIEGATVAVGGTQATTDRVGRFRLRGLSPGPAVLRAGAPGYEPREQPVELSARAQTGLEVALSRGARIRGKVLAASGEPAPGATVRAVPYRVDGTLAPAGGTARSGEDGAFDLESPAGAVRVEASSPVGESGRTDWFDLAPGTVREGIELHLAAAASLRGTVRRSDGAPAPGAEVRVAAADGRALAAAVTDAGGGYAVSGLPAGTVSVGAGAGEARGTAGPVELPAGGEIRLDVVLGSGTLAGVVVDGAGRPVAGAAVAVWPEGGSRDLAATAVTGGDGAFALAGLPEGIHRVEAVRGEARGEVRGVTPGTDDLRVEIGGGYLVGSVFVGRSPATDFTVAVSPLEPGRGGARAERILAADGRFRIPLGPGRWEVRASAPGASHGGALAEVPADGDSPEVRIELEAGGTVVGVVLDPEGRPVEAARVSTSRFGTWPSTARGDHPGAPRTITGPDGRFVLSGVSAGRAAVFAYHPGFRASRAAWVDVTAGEEAQVEVRLAPGEPGPGAGAEEATFGGIGMALGRTRAGVVAFGIVPGGPAHEAGVRNGDRIHAVDGGPVEDRPIEEIVERIRGPVGTPVVLEVSRPAEGDVRFRVVAIRTELRR
jgi:protocatechuate 3,4-dioxygenase beta subunit